MTRRQTRRARKIPRRNFERLENRVLLAGDLVAQWRAADLLSTSEVGETIAEWSDSVSFATATAFGTPTLVDRVIGGRPIVRFDTEGAKDGFRVSKAESPLSGATDFSVVVLFVTTSGVSENSDDWFDGTGIVHANQRGFNRDWGLALHGGQVGAGIGRGLFQPSTSVFSHEANLNDGKPHLAIFTRQADTLTLSIDGNPPATVSGASPDPRDSIDLVFGVPNSEPGAFVGDLAEVRFYDGALSAEEIATIRGDIDAFYRNEPPTANDDFFVTDEDVPLFVGANRGLLINDTDPEQDPLSARVVSTTEHGDLGLRPDGSFVYAPRDDFFGTDQFTYVVTDFRDSAPATVTIEVRPVHDPVMGLNDTYKARPDAPFVTDAADGVLANDVNADQQPIRAVLAREVSFGTLELLADGGFRYDAQGTSGLASFSYQIDDGGELSSPIPVLIDVNAPPVAVDDQFTLAEDSTLVRPAEQGLSANDADVEGNRLSVSIVDLPENGELVWDPSGAFEYTPRPDYFGADHFTYTVRDSKDESNVANVTLTITAINDPPVVNGETFFIPFNDAVVIEAERGLLANDSDIEDPQLELFLQQPPEHGQLDLAPDGSFTFTPDANYRGEDRFVYTVRDSGGAENQAETQLYIGTSPVLISEYMAANATLQTSVRESPSGRFSADVLTPDWIELVNTSSEIVSLGGLYLTDSEDLTTRWRFPDDVTIPANGHLVVFASELDIKDSRLDETGWLHTDFKLSSDSGEFLALLSPDGQLLDSLESIPAAIPGFSIGRREGDLHYLSEPTPNASNGEALDGVVADVVFSQPRGFYDAPVEVELHVDTPDALIYYTQNGSNPSPETGTLYTGPITVATTGNLRAAAFRPDYVPSRIATHTYLFVADVLQQPAAPEGFPDRWGNASAADYEMDPRVATDSTSRFYDPHVAEALRSLPTISLTMDVDDFFGPEGLQANPQAKGDRWERSTSVEFIDFEHFSDQQFDSGIRMVGNASRNPDRRKHNMRLAFRDDYGDSSLTLPLFGIGESESHENLILRGGNGDSWINPGVIQRAQYIRDQWQRDLQFAMGHLSTHQLYSHLYINGLYWGLYHVFERHDASFMALNLGGDDRDYEAIKDVNGNSAAVESVSGDTQAWEEIFTIVDDRDLSDAEKYAEVRQRVDLDNLIDYLLINFYAGNNDWDHNNFRAGRHLDGKFIFFTWDAERSDINALGVPTSGGPVTINVTTFNKAGRPTRIHSQLSDDADYVMRFADRVHKHFFNGGVLTPEVAGGQWNARADEIRLAMSAESARWGDLHSRSQPRGVDDWESTLRTMNEDFFPVRTQLVLEQLRRRGLYPDVAAPSFNQHGGMVPDGFELSMAAAEGTIYFTVDGTDPRQPGGAISPTALMFDETISVSKDTRILARVLLDGEWSALTEADFFAEARPANENSLRISEIHFNPGAPSDAEIAAGENDNDEFEFIEFVNISDHPIDLSQVQLLEINGSGVTFDFRGAAVTRLAPNERVVVVEDVAAFKLRYGNDLPVAGQWSGRLANGGETIYLASEGNVFLELSYDDQWYPETDGNGHSLELLNPAALDFSAWDSAEGWRSSLVAEGTPGSDADGRVPGDSNRDGVFNTSDLVLVFQAGEYEDRFVNNSTYAEGDWNGDGEFDSKDFVFAFQFGYFEAEEDG